MWWALKSNLKRQWLLLFLIINLSGPLPFFDKFKISVKIILEIHFEHHYLKFLFPVSVREVSERR